MADDAVSSGYFSQDNIAAAWWLANCSVVPIRPDGQKRPYLAWNDLQRERATADTVRKWFQGQYSDPGVAVICGRVSDNLEMLELEGRAYNPSTLAAISDACDEAGCGDLWRQLTTSGYSERTPGGGVHLLYRVLDHEVPGNQRVAARPATVDEYTDAERHLAQRNPNWQPVRVMVETRGEGGYVIVAPSSGRCHPNGLPWTALTGTPADIITISWQQRCLLHATIRTLLHVPVTQDLVPMDGERPAPQVERDPDAPLSPVEDFNERSSWFDSWFLEAGWTVHHRGANGEVFWCRPGKDPSEQHAASTGVRVAGQDCLYVWSTSTSLPTESPLTKFMVFAHYRFNDDRSAAARWLQRNGYGPALHPPAPVLREFTLEDDGDGQLPVVYEEDLPGVADGTDHRLDALRRDLTGGSVLTDNGYAMRLADQYKRTLRYNTDTKTWYHWAESVGKWEEDKYTFVEEAAKRQAEQTYTWIRGFAASNAGEKKVEDALKPLVKRAQDGLNQARLVAVVNRYRATEGVSVPEADFDATPDLLNLRNGTLSLTNYELREHNPEDMLSCAFNASYNPDAECPEFEKYLNVVFTNEEIRSYIQRAMGYSLLGRPHERALFLLHGPSGTGKSVFIEVMTSMFGDYGVTSPSSTFKAKKQESTFDLHQLKGKRFVAISELAEGMQLDEELIKRVASGGGDRMQSRALYQGFIEWVPKCVLWMATNFLPRLSGDDDAIWRRIRTIPMKTIIQDIAGGETKGLGGMLMQESDGILNWILDGLREYRRVGLNEPQVVLDDIDKYRTETDSVASWFRYSVAEGQYVPDADATLQVSMAYEHYTAYCLDNGLTKYGKQRFTKKLSNLNRGLGFDTRGGVRVITGMGPARRGL